MGTTQIAVLIVVGAAAFVGLAFFLATAPFGKFRQPLWRRMKPWQRAGVKAVLMIAASCAFMLIVVLIAEVYQGGESSSGHRALSEETKKKMYYDMIATQDQNPYSNEWNKGVKQAAADYYNIPMSQVDDIIHEGVAERWLTPPPP